MAQSRSERISVLRGPFSRLQTLLERPLSALPSYLRGLGVLFLVFPSVLYAHMVALGIGAPPIQHLIWNTATSAPFVAILLYSPRWFESEAIPPTRYTGIGWWFLGGLLGFLGLNLFMMILWGTNSAFQNFLWALWAGCAGGAIGLAGGIFKARSVERELDAERQKIRLEEARRQNQQLEKFANIVSHDLKNPLSVAVGNVELAKEECQSDNLDTAIAALDRMEAIVEETLTLARSGQVIDDTEPIDLATFARRAWETVDTAEAEIDLQDSVTFEGDPGRVRHLLENLFRNAVEHGATDATVRVGALGEGFYVEDDGTGIPADARDSIFEVGHSTAADGTGFGLAIVDQIVDAHGWDVEVTTGVDGGARFEITGVDVVAT